jgi:hypothetical protein
MGRPTAGTQAWAMSIARTDLRTRLTALATVVALMATLVATLPAAAGDTVRAKTAERYALSLLNCTRTGGKVTSAGSCLGRGSGTYSAYRQPLRLHKGISDKVAWPWARALAVNDVCGHSIAGKPSLAQRLSRKGYRYPYYGENVGCGTTTASPGTVVLYTHRLMQAEQKYGGGHWKNIKNPDFKSVGIGVARYGSRTRVVYEFYGKKY